MEHGLTPPKENVQTTEGNIHEDDESESDCLPLKTMERQDTESHLMCDIDEDDITTKLPLYEEPSQLQISSQRRHQSSKNLGEGGSPSSSHQSLLQKINNIKPTISKQSLQPKSSVKKKVINLFISSGQSNYLSNTSVPTTANPSNSKLDDSISGKQLHTQGSAQK